jgi:ribokinase
MLDVLVVDEHEAAWLGAHLNCDATTAGLHAALGIDVVQTLGEHGIEAVTSAGTIRLPARLITPVDTAWRRRLLHPASSPPRSTAARPWPWASPAPTPPPPPCAARARGPRASMPVAAETDAALTG